MFALTTLGSVNYQRRKKNKMRTRTNFRALFGTLLVVVALGAACAKKPVATTPPPPPPPVEAPPARPTVNLQASSTFVQRNETVTLTWSSTNATSLNLSPGIGPVTAQGTQRVTPSDSMTYSITATGPGGSADASVHITVSAPPPPTPVSHEPSLQEMFDKEVKDAYFDLDKADIRTDARDALSQTAQFLRSYPQLKIVVEGHCDERGSTEYNLALGDRRAAAAKQFLVSLGIPADRMETVSYGKEKPFCTASTEDCWQQNRRAHFVMGK
jgi:peptidoglycan-associated lipoprotein